MASGVPDADAISAVRRGPPPQFATTAQRRFAAFRFWRRTAASGRFRLSARPMRGYQAYDLRHWTPGEIGIAAGPGFAKYRPDAPARIGGRGDAGRGKNRPLTPSPPITPRPHAPTPKICSSYGPARWAFAAPTSPRGALTPRPQGREGLLSNPRHGTVQSDLNAGSRRTRGERRGTPAGVGAPFSLPKQVDFRDCGA